MVKVALFEPEIPQNTGNIARLCAGTDVELILVGKLGFSLSDKHLKRAGLDYWDHVKLKRVQKLGDFFTEYPEGNFEYAFISKFGKKLYTDIPINGDLIIIFGNESYGLPDELKENYSSRLYRIPMNDKIRSQNLSNSVAIVLYDILRRNNFEGLS